MKFPLAAPRCGHCHHLEHDRATCDVQGCICPEVYFVKPRWHQRLKDFITHPTTRLAFEVVIGAIAVRVAVWVAWRR
jgi:hypothetical protein